MSAEASAKIAAANAGTPVVVWSKKYCGYCDRVLCLLASIEPHFPVKVFQLDEMPDGSDVHAALLELTSCMTVPQVFVGGTFIGGCTETTELHTNKQLTPAIAAAVAAHVAGEDIAAANFQHSAAAQHADNCETPASETKTMA